MATATRDWQPQGDRLQRELQWDARYDAAVIAGGFVRLGRGTTSAATANVHAVTGKFLASARALLVVSLVGTSFIDLFSALLIKFLMAQPLMQPGPGGLSCGHDYSSHASRSS